MTSHGSFLETNGARIHYEVDGDGPPVVFVHAGVANLRMWDDQVAALRDAYRCIRHDTRGYGRTDTDRVAFSNRADIADLLDELGERSAHVVGLSRGAMIALDFALEFPDRVRSLVCAAGGVGGFEPPAETDASVWTEWERIADAKDWAALADWETRFWADGPGQPEDRVPEVHRQVRAWVHESYAAEKEEGEPQPLDPPANARLDGLRAPLLVMLGTLDEPETQASMRHLAEAVPGARLEVFETAHMINLEEPERFTRLLREHLDAAEASAG